MTHELAHQWFGNLARWIGGHLWLNGVSRVDTNRAANKVSGLQNVGYLVSGTWLVHRVSTRSILSSDSMIRRAEEVEAVFDAISYSKGACGQNVLRVDGGGEVSRRLRIYMKRHQYVVFEREAREF